MPRLADVAEWTEYAKGQELRAEAAEARVAELGVLLHRLYSKAVTMATNWPVQRTAPVFEDVREAMRGDRAASKGKGNDA